MDALVCPAKLRSNVVNEVGSRHRPHAQLWTFDRLAGSGLARRLDGAGSDIDALSGAAHVGIMWKPVLFVLAAFAMGGCSGGCENTILSEEGSPNGRLTATLFERSCGATTGYSTQVSVLRSGVRSAAAGNTFVADANHGTAEQVAVGGPWVEVVWIDDDNLIVRYDAQARVFTEQSDIAGVKVTYQPIER